MERNPELHMEMCSCLFEMRELYEGEFDLKLWLQWMGKG